MEAFQIGKSLELSPVSFAPWFRFLCLYFVFLILAPDC